MIEYIVLIFVSLAISLWIFVKEIEFDIAKILMINLVLLSIVIIQYFLFYYADISIKGYYDFSFWIFFQCSGIIFFFSVFRRNGNYLGKIYGLLMFLMILPSWIVALNDERPVITNVNEGVEIRRFTRRIMACGHYYQAVVSYYFLFEKSFDIPFPQCQFEKSKSIQLKDNKLNMLVQTHDGEMIETSVLIN